MTSKEVAASYNRLAAHWAGPEFDQNNGLPQVAHAIRFAAQHGRALDVGCGSSGRIIELLKQHGFVPEGLDLSSEMLRLARMRHPEVTFHEADVCRWDAPGKYDFIVAWDSIWHVPLSEQRALLLKLCATLSERGVLVFTCGGLDDPGEKHDPCMGAPMYHATLGIPEVLRTILDAGCAVRHLEYDQFPESHVYIVAQRTWREIPV